MKQMENLKKKNNRIIFTFLIICVVVIVLGGVLIFADNKRVEREKKEKENSTLTDGEKIAKSTGKIRKKNSKIIDGNNSGTLYCARGGVAQGDLTVTMKYIVNYVGDNITTYNSIEGVQIEDGKDNDSNQTYLREYYDAYDSIKNTYSGIDNYDVNLNHDGNMVTFEISIDYNKVDIDKIIKIEGEEDNIFVDGKASVSKWIDLASSVGTVCKDNEEGLVLEDKVKIDDNKSEA